MAAFISFCVAIGFISSGGYILAFTLNEIYLAYLELDKNTFLITLTNWLTDQPLFIDSMYDFRFMLGKGTATLIAVILLLYLASKVIYIASHFIATGFRILYPGWDNK